MGWRTLFLFGFVGILAACEGSTPVHEFTIDPQRPPQEKPQSTPVPGNPPPVQRPDEVTWFQVAPIFENKCAECHNAGSSMLDAYQTLPQVRRSIRRIVRFAVEKSVMPPAPDEWPDNQLNPNALLQEEKDLISRWVADGMKD